MPEPSPAEQRAAVVQVMVGLVALSEAAEARADQLQRNVEVLRAQLTRTDEESLAAIERADQLQRERDEALQENESILQQVAEDYHYQRAERAEAALREILHEVGSVTQSPKDAAAAANRIARAALARETSP